MTPNATNARNWWRRFDGRKNGETRANASAHVGVVLLFFPAVCGGCCFSSSSEVSSLLLLFINGVASEGRVDVGMVDVWCHILLSLSVICCYDC